MAHPKQAVVDKVNEILGTGSPLAQYTEPVVDRLVCFGFLPLVSDAPEIAFTMQKAVQNVLNDINQVEMPDELKYITVDWIVGEFLMGRYSTGRLELQNISFEGGGLESVTEGDTTVKYRDGATSGEAKFKALIAMLQNGGNLVCCRKIKW